MKKIILLLTTMFVLCIYVPAQYSINKNIDDISQAVTYLSLKDQLELLVESEYVFPTNCINKDYYIAQQFQDNTMYSGNHLGIDITRRGHKNIDLGDTIYAINNGIVEHVHNDFKEYISIYHKWKGNIIKAIYLHCLVVFKNNGDHVKVGEPIALIGNGGGSYSAHLHLEIASDTSKWYGGYGLPEGWIDPMKILPSCSKNK